MNCIVYLTIYRKGVRDVTPGKCLESFMHFMYFIVYLVVNFSGPNCQPRKFVGILPIYYRLFDYFFGRSQNPGKFLESFMHCCVIYRLFTTICFLTLGDLIVIQETLSESLLHFIDYLTNFQKGVRSVTAEIFLESFMHIHVFYRLFTTVCFGTLGSGVFPQIICQDHSCILGVFYWLFDIIFRKEIWQSQPCFFGILHAFY